ncbi:delta-like protein B [Pecten maximus]|uniref:delta-like protein B n=1 Tax=Pecten maximus TaxID=6579 RepID=UPI001458E928|nr:delta-like protein B [Pecten maximus]
MHLPTMEANGRVSYSLRLVSFTNPNGTSWDGLHYHGNRRLCDSNGTDTCDTYFKICIQRKGRCFINYDSKVFSNTNNITFGNEAMWTGTSSTWNTNLLAFINPFDKDSSKAAGDLIDILNFPLSIELGLKQGCSVNQTIVMSNHTTLTMEFKVWCSQGYTGPGCTYRYTGSNPYVSCDNGQLNLLCTNQDICQHEGKCNNIDGGFTCHCTDGWTGDRCQTDVNECEHNPCLHSGTCHNINGNYTCHCSDGWTGHICDNDINECQNNPCDHGGTCNNVNGSYTCHCSDGWTGHICDNDVNECQIYPCQHGGTCNNINGNYTCQCATGWAGWHCDRDVNECEIRPTVCLNNGTCTNEEGGYSCACWSGWAGENCTSDVNECYQNVCKNNATCTNIYGGYHCQCTEGWLGITCEQDIDECHGHPCHNEATCLNIAGSFKCMCTSGWSGVDCDVDIDECKLNVCYHGTCKNTDGGFACACFEGWTGSNCTYDVRSTTGHSVRESTISYPGHNSTIAHVALQTTVELTQKTTGIAITSKKTQEYTPPIYSSSKHTRNIPGVSTPTTSYTHKQHKTTQFSATKTRSSSKNPVTPEVSHNSHSSRYANSKTVASNPIVSHSVTSSTGGVGTSSKITKPTVAAAGPSNASANKGNQSWASTNWPTLVGVGGGVLIVVISALIFYRKRKMKANGATYIDETDLTSTDTVRDSTAALVFENAVYNTMDTSHQYVCSLDNRDEIQDDEEDAYSEMNENECRL